MTDRIRFDPYDPAVHARGPDAFAAMASRCPVYHYNGRFDFFVASDPADVREGILRDPATWTIEEGSSPKLLPPEQRTALMDDTAYHNKVRFVMQRGFSPRELARLHETVQRLADELIDAMLADPQGRGDLFERFVMPLPARLMCVMLGVPEADHMLYKEWADAYFYDILNDAGTGMSVDSLAQVSTPVFAELARRRALLADRGLEPDLALLGAELPHDFLSRFMCDRIDGRYLRDDEILSVMLGIIVGGNETTMNLIGNLLSRLLGDRALWEQVRADRKLVDAAIEESLRIDPPVIGLFRAARHDTTLGGVAVPAHAKVFYNIAAANRDPAIFTEPDTFRLDRPRAQMRHHVAFAGGNHSCIGEPLVRMEVRAVLNRLLDRMPDLDLDGEPRRAAGFNVCGWNYLPMRWR
ncbi:cytochrome P450 [Sphingobium fontiphilum]|uniref:Cytochrome P450 n=1 Tax=Sphingobium fontiphilum TaxID=944425 RepID=A0A7W6GNE0_9SPHN|nr:cytochrome P450 [Sphingobium fontiphilum]